MVGVAPAWCAAIQVTVAGCGKGGLAIGALIVAAGRVTGGAGP